MPHPERGSLGMGRREGGDANNAPPCPGLLPSATAPVAPPKDRACDLSNSLRLHSFLSDRAQKVILGDCDSAPIWCHWIRQGRAQTGEERTPAGARDTGSSACCQFCVWARRQACCCKAQLGAVQHFRHSAIATERFQVASACS